MTRTQNSFFNVITGIGSKLLLVILNFITRSVFIKTLGESYLGIEGVFTNILSMLSLAELGFGSAIVFKLYRPIEENDRKRILVLVKLYRKTYFIIGCVIALLGICLIPFLPKLAKDYYLFSQLGLNAAFIFLLYLFNSVSSYWFFAYKTAFVQANQKSYLLNLLGYATSIANSLCQILVLKFTRDFVVYILVQIGFSVLTNMLYALICDRRYPYLKEKTSERISREELKEFFKDCSALLLYRASSVITNASDTIVLSALVGLQTVGLYANYLSLKNSIRSLLFTCLTSIQASLGSLYSVGKIEWSRLIFRVVNFCTVIIYGISSIGMAVLMDDFVALWLGDRFVVTTWTYNGITFYMPIAILIGVEVYAIGLANFCSSFRNAMGLFQELKYRPIATVVLNLLICIVAVPYIGIAGCILSTIISLSATNLIFDPMIIHKHALKQSSRPYFLRNLAYLCVFLVAGVLTWWVCGLIPLEGIPGFIVRGCICVAIPGILFVLCFFRTEEFRFLLSTVKALLHRTKK